MNDKYVKLADVKRKLRYIFKAYGVGNFVKEKVEKTLGNLPYSVKGDLETTLEAADVKRGKWILKENAILTSECSLCKRSVSMLEAKFYKFCPYCGAKMEEFQKEMEREKNE